MSLKKVLIIPLLISIVLLLVFSGNILRSVDVLVGGVAISPAFIGAVVIAVLLQFAGHYVRAYKAHYILKPVRNSTTKFQFRALSLGYLFNAILPIRIGEIVRSYVMATADKISWGLSLSVVLLERSIDTLFLFLVAVVLIVLSLASFQSIALGLVAFLLFALTVIGGLSALVSENKWLLMFVYRSSALFNPHVKRSIRFKTWSVIYGLQQIIGKRSLATYIALSFASWMLYFASMAVLLTQLNMGVKSAGDIAVLSASPYYGIAIPSGPGSLGSYSGVVDSLTSNIALGSNEQTIYNLVSWAVIVVPIAVVGIVLLLTKTREPFRRRLTRGSSDSPLLDKLSREEDISDDMDLFLENYFSNNALSRMVHRLERAGDFKLLKYFKGGSDAITILVAKKDGSTVVKKIIALEHKDRLSAQYDWLKNHKHTNVVKVLREETGPDYYSIDISYNKTDEMFFDYMHSHSVKDSERVMRNVWEALSEILYKNTKTLTDYKALDAYIEKHVWSCLDQAAAVNADIALASACDTLIINGQKYDGIRNVMSRIMGSKQARKDIATYAHSDEVDGDIAIDNILVSGGKHRPVIIDPAPDGNIINGPVFDFGKNMQSLYCGYEFLFRSNESVILEDGNKINFQDRRSEQCVRLCDYVRHELAPKYLSDAEQKAIIFHAATLHIRRLKHQVYQNPAIALAMFAVGVRAYNDFINQYDEV